MKGGCFISTSAVDYVTREAARTAGSGSQLRTLHPYVPRCVEATINLDYRPGLSHWVSLSEATRGSALSSMARHGDKS